MDKNYLLSALDDRSISNVDGWLSIHNCVSAVSFYFLAQQNKNSNPFKLIKKYFDEEIEYNINIIVTPL
ncbi:hypothetical protein WFZ85_14835 [Flavobacterium sp. j3]|uniref:Uncharacterized protein n=1 Tax=Flavobacterium aureirubrum TaxID=3133147 RepID=A0ABU9N874_9FLAO